MKYILKRPPTQPNRSSTKHQERKKKYTYRYIYDTLCPSESYGVQEHTIKKSRCFIDLCRPRTKKRVESKILVKWQKFSQEEWKESSHMYDVI